MERYLIEQYDVYEDENYLKSEDDIMEFFHDNGRDFMESGQGYYQNEVDLICKVDDKFYSVSIIGEVASEKQDYGDRLYWIESIVSVEYEEIDKPLPKETTKLQYNVRLSNEQRQLLENFMKENNISF